MDYRIIIYIIFGILPSLTWLAYYLSKDLHPEPKRMIIKVFLWGALITVPVFFVQIGLNYLLGLVNISPLASSIIYWFLIIALSEEFFKYLVIKMQVVNSPHLDEPLDIMLYMVVAALGFAALENVLYLFPASSPMSFNALISRTLAITFIRFIGATFLHTLCSAVVGYCLAMSFYDVKKKFLYLSMGIVMATLLHGIYDFSIMTLGGDAKVAIPAAVIIILAFLVFAGFDKLKKMPSISKVK